MLNQISLDDFSDGLPPTTLEDTHPTAPVPGLPLSTQLRRPEVASLPELAHPELFRAEAGFPDEPIPPEFGGPVPSPRGPVPAREVPPPPVGRIRPDTPATSDTPARTARRRRYWRVAAAAAVVLVFVIGGVLGWRATQPEPVQREAAGITWTASTPDGSATADARLIDHEWGTEIQMRDPRPAPWPAVLRDRLRRERVPRDRGLVGDRPRQRRGDPGEHLDPAQQDRRNWSSCSMTGRSR